MLKKQEQGTRWERIKKTFYDSETKKFLGRDGRNWALIFIFYVIAYSLLVGFWFGMIAVFLNACITFDKPTLTGMHSLLKLNPGLAFLPRLDVLTTFHQFTKYPSSINAEYIQETKIMLQQYSNITHTADCSAKLDKDFPDIPCRFPIETLGECSDAEQSMSEGKPCFYLKINRIYGWLPNIANTTESDKILIECLGQNPIDTALLGEPKYFPEHVGTDGKRYGYIDPKYFPFLNQDNYQNPLVAVQFPNINPSTVVLVECRLRGLVSSDAAVHFELCVDSKIQLPSDAKA